MNGIKAYFSVILTFVLVINVIAQTDQKTDKVSHAEPLYLDLVRDLGTRKGEKELNVGSEMINKSNYHEYAFIVEYEFSPINRLGVEVEADFSFFKRTQSLSDVPNHRLEYLQLSTQYSFFVSSKLKTTLATGYTQTATFTDFKKYDNGNFITGTVYNPFFITAKRWGNNFHTLVYTCPLFEHNFATNTWNVNWRINTSFHYVIPQTRHFIGIELYKTMNHGKFEMTIRPQIKIKLNKNLALGIATSIPILNHNKAYSLFLRIIYEP